MDGEIKTTMNPISTTIQFIGLIMLGMGLILAAFLVKRNLRQSDSQHRYFHDFSPDQINQLKESGLLSEEEARKIQSVVADRAVQSLEAQKKQAKPVELQDLLSEAETAIKTVRSNNKTNGEEQI